MSIKKVYHYLFYKLYKFWEVVSIPKFWSDWKAELSIDILELFIIGSIVYYFDIDLDNGKLFYFLCIAGICIPNYFIFHHKDQWKYYKIEFDNLSKKQNKIRGIIVWCIIIFVITNLILSVYCMDLRARKNHTGPYSKEYLEQIK